MDKKEFKEKLRTIYGDDGWPHMFPEDLPKDRYADTKKTDEAYLKAWVSAGDPHVWNKVKEVNINNDHVEVWMDNGHGDMVLIVNDCIYRGINTVYDHKMNYFCVDSYYTDDEDFILYQRVL